MVLTLVKIIFNLEPLVYGEWRLLLVDIEVQYKKLGVFNTISTTNSTHQFSVWTLDSPNNSTCIIRNSDRHQCLAHEEHVHGFPIRLKEWHTLNSNCCWLVHRHWKCTCTLWPQSSPFPPLSNWTRFLTNAPVFKSHSFTVPSSLLVTTKLSVNCKLVTALWCLLGPWSVCKHCPDVMSHTYRSRYNVQTGIKNRVLVLYCCISCWRYTLHVVIIYLKTKHASPPTLTVESALPDTSVLLLSSIPLVKDWWPAGQCTLSKKLNTNLPTIKPLRVCKHWPESAFHTLICVSKEPLTMCTPSNYRENDDDRFDLQLQGYRSIYSITCKE